MISQHGRRVVTLRPPALLLGAASLALILAGCGGTSRTEPGPPATGGIAVEDAWARPAKAMPGMGTTSAAYFVLRNDGKVADTLVGAGADVADKAEFHETVAKGDGVTMRPVKSVPLPSGGTVAFKPGGLHVMLVDLKRDLAAGDKFPLILQFEKGGTQTVEVVVREP